ncbi:MAG: DUF1643 domain-containing protein [Planctomycetota bacterium]
MTGGVAFARSGAAVSACGLFRYALTRVWDDARPTLGWVMLNPSKADATASDRTLEACVGFSSRAGFGGLRIENLFAFRATRPGAIAARLEQGLDVVGPRNDASIRRMVSVCDAVAVAWGATLARRASERRERVLGLLPSVLVCLGTTKDGHPRHPSRLPYSTRVSRYR